MTDHALVNRTVPNVNGPLVQLSHPQPFEVPPFIAPLYHIITASTAEGVFCSDFWLAFEQLDYLF